ncbi:MAG: Uma2 family endonuclease [Methylococcales bacterium]|nr:Uma2 family endonuclease [Methylococcales bacterium]MDD5755170.1 Uma2 family endonuclease [Methylococcales bacterium]
MNLPNHKTDYISEQDYLEGEKISEIKHEYIDGEVYAMAGASKNHQRLLGNVFSALHHHLKNTPCEAFSSDIKVRADKGKKYFYPDVIVVCSNNDNDDYYTESPRIIVEVLSNSTRKYDRTLKRQIYQSIPSLEEYVLIEQDRVEIEVCRKSEGWQSMFYYIDDEITFTSIGLTLPVLEIYSRVENDEMRVFVEANI